MQNHFRRTRLAKDLADRLLGGSLLSDARNGLFLAQARRTGKTWFLRLDLAPELEARGWLVLYADLWKNINENPGTLIAIAIEDALASNNGWVAKGMKALQQQTGLDSVGVPDRKSVV